MFSLVPDVICGRYDTGWTGFCGTVRPAKCDLTLALSLEKSLLET